MDQRDNKNRELTAVSAAFIENGTFLRKFLTRFLSSSQDVEDVAQEAYLRAYVAEQKNEIDQPKAFLFQVAKNVALTRLTKKSAQITDYLEESLDLSVLDQGAAADKEVEALETLGLYCEAVASLTDKAREVFLLRKVHGLSHKEISARMELSVSSVEKYLRQGIAECSAHLNRSEGRTVDRTQINRLRRSANLGNPENE